MVNFCVAILILKVKEENKEIWGILFFYHFKKGKNATEKQTNKNNICAVYGEGAVIDQMCQKWFEKFRARDFSLDNAPWSGRPVEVENGQIETLIENNQRYTMQKIANILKISKLMKLLVKMKNVSYL